MLTIRNEQLEKLLDQNDTILSEALAENSFGKHGFYAPMPRDVRLLLAKAAVREARNFNMTTAITVAEFVQAMIDMSPRFPEMDPFYGILKNTELTDNEKIDQILSEDMTQHWEAVSANLVENENWHLDYWDEKIDWDKAELRR